MSSRTLEWFLLYHFFFFHACPKRSARFSAKTVLKSHNRVSFVETSILLTFEKIHSEKILRLKFLMSEKNAKVI